MDTKTTTGIAASAAAVATATAMFLISAAIPTTPTYAAKGAPLVHCHGVNSCKGESECKSATHECKGENECKGQGFKVMTAKQCAAAGGTLTEPK